MKIAGLNALLVFLISSIVVTGISFLDGQIWNVIFYLIGLLAYSIVGGLYSIGLLQGVKAGKEAYAFVFFLLLLGGIGTYVLLNRFKIWICSWPIFVKILVPSLLLVAFIVVLIIRISAKTKDDKNMKEINLDE